MNLIETLHKIQITNDYMEEIIKNSDYNKTIINYYYQLQAENENENVLNKIDLIADCNRLWHLDHYKEQKIKDFKKTNLCKDKFCNNCKKVKQASRMSRFIPELQKLEDEFDLYHVTFTLPNLEGHDAQLLSDTINNMFKSYGKLTQYLNHTKKIKDIDFYRYGYVGSIRSLEVTYNGSSYHPHLHCIFVLKKDLKLSKRLSNTYSKSRKNGKRKFSIFEIQLQKIWRLLIEGDIVNKINIDNLDIGYSCSLDKIEEEHYYEVFKYMTKSNAEDSEDFMSYNNFKVLYYSLKNKRQIQGYGLLFRIKEDKYLEEVADAIYDDVINELLKKENPVEISETPQDLIKDNESLIISRKKIFNYLKQL